MSTDQNTELGRAGPMEDGSTFEQALAQRFAQIRNRYQLSLEDIAAGAQSLGFDWTRGKVWAIEKLAKGTGSAGTRRLTVSEFLALPAIFERALRQRGAAKTFTLHDLLPRDHKVAIGVFTLPGDAVASILHGSSFNFDPFEDQALQIARAASSARASILQRIAREEVPEVAQEVGRAARGAVERSVAKKFGVPPELIAIASEQRWGKTLTSQRNDLMGAPPEGLSEAGEMAWRNAARGHATRDILDDDEFRQIVGSLVERYGSALDQDKDPNSPGGANDPRFAFGRPGRSAGLSLFQED